MNKTLKIVSAFLFVVLLALEALAQNMGIIQCLVTATDGQPVPRAAIIFKNSSQNLITMADGRSAGRMYPGKYSAFIFKLGYKTVIRHDVEILADSTTVLKITLEPDPVNQGRGTIAGRIFDQKNKPVAGAKVIIADSYVPKSGANVTIEDFILEKKQIEGLSDRDVYYQYGANVLHLVQIEAITDRNGNFIFENVPPGRFTAFVMKDGYRSHMDFAIYVETGKTKTIKVKLHEQKFSSIYGKVKSVDGEAIPGANITLTGTRLGAASDPLGNFIIKEVPPGKYILNVAMLGFNPYQQSIVVEKNKHQKLVITIEPDISFKLEKKSELQAYEDRLEELRQVYFLAESETDQEETRRQIRALLETMFDLKEKEYAKDIEAKKRNIQSLEQLQKYRAANKDDIIERRLKELLTVY